MGFFDEKKMSEDQKQFPDIIKEKNNKQTSYNWNNPSSTMINNSVNNVANNLPNYNMFNNSQLSSSLQETYIPQVSNSFHMPIKRQLRPNFSNTQINNVEIPNQIAKEIRGEKWRIMGLVFLGTLFMFSGLFFTLLHFLAPVVNDAQLKIPLTVIPHPALMIILATVGLVFFLVGWVDFFNLKIGVRNYRSDILMGVESIPYFLIKNYKSLSVRLIYLNWISFNVYIFGGIIIGIFYAIRSGTKGAKPMNTEIIIMFIILVLTLFYQITTLINVRSRKGRICAYYGFEIVPPEQIADVRKRANRLCLIIFLIFLIALFLIIFIPWMIIRKNKNKSLIPFL